MKKIATYFVFFFLLFLSLSTSAQAPVPVREEPRHKPVLVNKYFRLLNVYLQAGDTTQYHIHATPSLFLQFTSAYVGNQIPGSDWKVDSAFAGYSWYRSFTPDSMIHRVSNNGNSVFHVTDIELLSSYQPEKQKKALPLPLMYENEKAFAYKIDRASIKNASIKKRGPMLAELISGGGVVYHDLSGKEKKRLNPGDYLYIDPEKSFRFTGDDTDELNLVLFELK